MFFVDLCGGFGMFLVIFAGLVKICECLFLLAGKIRRSCGDWCSSHGFEQPKRSTELGLKGTSLCGLVLKVGSVSRCLWSLGDL